jgi:nitroreductase
MTGRTTDQKVDSLFLDRWSPRAFDGSSIPAADRDALFEAARWAPSAFNAQPWRLLYAERGDANWDRFLTGLIPFNQGWAKEAGLLVYFVSSETSSDKPLYSHSFDTGAAWMSLALQAERLGLRAHGMTGLDFDTARTVLGIPEGYRLEAAVAVGRQGDAASLPDGLREREVPSDRKPLAEVAIAGSFPG